MSIHRVSIANAAVAAFVSTVLSALLSTASADSTTTRAVSTGTAQRMNDTYPRGKQPSSCVVVERPKHTIRKCRCDSGALSGVASIDATEMIRLLLGSSACRSPTPPRK
jgi:hypothetical protein